MTTDPGLKRPEEWSGIVGKNKFARAWGFVVTRMLGLKPNGDLALSPWAASEIGVLSGLFLIQFFFGILGWWQLWMRVFARGGMEWRYAVPAFLLALPIPYAVMAFDRAYLFDVRSRTTSSSVRFGGLALRIAILFTIGFLTAKPMELFLFDDKVQQELAAQEGAAETAIRTEAIESVRRQQARTADLSLGDIRRDVSRTEAENVAARERFEERQRTHRAELQREAQVASEKQAPPHYRMEGDKRIVYYVQSEIDTIREQARATRAALEQWDQRLAQQERQTLEEELRKNLAETRQRRDEASGKQGMGLQAEIDQIQSMPIEQVVRAYGGSWHPSRSILDIQRALDTVTTADASAKATVWGCRFIVWIFDALILAFKAFASQDLKRYLAFRLEELLAMHRKACEALVGGFRAHVMVAFHQQIAARDVRGLHLPQDEILMTIRRTWDDAMTEPLAALDEVLGEFSLVRAPVPVWPADLGDDPRLALPAIISEDELKRRGWVDPAEELPRYLRDQLFEHRRLWAGGLRDALFFIREAIARASKKGQHLTRDALTLVVQEAWETNLGSANGYTARVLESMAALKRLNLPIPPSYGLLDDRLPPADPGWQAWLFDPTTWASEFGWIDPSAVRRTNNELINRLWQARSKLHSVMTAANRALMLIVQDSPTYALSVFQTRRDAQWAGEVLPALDELHALEREFGVLGIVLPPWTADPRKEQWEERFCRVSEAVLRGWGWQGPPAKGSVKRRKPRAPKSGGDGAKKTKKSPTDAPPKRGRKNHLS